MQLRASHHDAAQLELDVYLNGEADGVARDSFRFDLACQHAGTKRTGL
jgi:hypothetical protein